MHLGYMWYWKQDIIKLYGLIQIIRYIIKIFRVCFKDFSIKHALIFVFRFAFYIKKVSFINFKNSGKKYLRIVQNF